MMRGSLDSRTPDMPDDRDALLSTLAWWVEAGVDTLVEESSGGWQGEAEPAPSPVESAAPIETEKPKVQKPVAVDISASTLSELRSAVEMFEGCALRGPNSNTVFADGNPQADLMLIGEAPGAQEDRQGIPFVGPAGQLLDRMLAAIGRDRTTSYITNVIFWRPPGNRTPSPEEVATCLPFVHRHIALVRPKVIMAVGAVAARALLNETTGILRLRGSWRKISVEGEEYDLLPTLHPAYLLRQPEQKRLSWADLLAVKEKLDAD